MPATSATDLKESTGKRKRLTQACEGCRRKKVKCDGAKPRCRNCDRLNQDCNYVNTGRRGRTAGTSKARAKVAKPSPMPMAAAAASLKAMVPQLSTAASTATSPTALGPVMSLPIPAAGALPDPLIHPTLSSHPSPSHTNGHSVLPGPGPLEDAPLPATASLPGAPAPLPPPPLSSTPPKHSPSYTALSRMAMVQTLEKNLDECIRAMNCSLHLGNTSGLTYRSPFFPKIPGLVRSPANYEAPTLTASPAKSSAAIHPTDAAPPPNWDSDPDLGLLLTTFFRYGHQAVPVVDRTRFQDSLRAQQPVPVLVYSMCAFATNYLAVSAKVRQAKASKYVQLFQSAMTHAHNHPSVEHIQALLIMAHHETATANIYRAWNYSGQATRMTLALGLNVLDGEAGANHPSARNLPTDDAGLEWLRQVFWSCFLYDRFWSLELGFSNAIDEREICLYLPRVHPPWCPAEPGYQERYEHDEASAVIDANDVGKIETMQSGQAVGPDVFLIKLVTLFGDILRLRNRSEQFYHTYTAQISRQFATIDESLAAWALSLPEYLALEYIPTDLQPKLDGVIRDMRPIYEQLGQASVFPSDNEWAQDELGRCRGFILNLHAYYHVAIMFLHRCRILDADNHHPTIEATGLETSHSYERCYSAMTKVSEIAQHVLDLDARFVSPFLPFAFYHAALFLISFANYVPETEFVQHWQRIQQLRRALEHTQHCWGISKYYLQVLAVDHPDLPPGIDAAVNVGTSRMASPSTAATSADPLVAVSISELLATSMPQVMPTIGGLATAAPPPPAAAATPGYSLGLSSLPLTAAVDGRGPLKAPSLVIQHPYHQATLFVPPADIGHLYAASTSSSPLVSPANALMVEPPSYMSAVVNPAILQGSDGAATLGLVPGPAQAALAAGGLRPTMALSMDGVQPGPPVAWSHTAPSPVSRPPSQKKPEIVP
ncbi:hypothetical protein H4R34_001147 [Dimargaris verticillata]|uniref:Zn(2)-C6 fungal-type domain-containing protein n=1 Tax=Dimargaris verticillata TaxID=2761393 RepID=A0A9W8EF88_9FUNG|nr:hypothetical protein H4R34_001147 [Dimargaris verticillata]